MDCAEPASGASNCGGAGAKVHWKRQRYLVELGIADARNKAGSTGFTGLSGSFLAP